MSANIKTNKNEMWKIDAVGTTGLPIRINTTQFTNYIDGGTPSTTGTGLDGGSVV